MSDRSRARELIETLTTGNFYADCPCCDEPTRLRDAGLFYLDDFTPEAAARHRQMVDEQRARRAELRRRRRDIPARSARGAEAVNIGFILERLAPAMPSFAFDRNDCRSLFDPIDYVIFEGLSRRGRVTRVIFADIKTGKAALAKKQREIRELVARKRVAFDTYDTGATDES